jgi:hypothetical protein
MAGIRFWPEMHPLDQDFNRKADNFEQIVSIFTNVIYDTSQFHANTIFSDMFAWLEVVLELIRAHPETLFVIRAHPDEMRPGKRSRESVQDWVERHMVDSLGNVIFVRSTEHLSSYEVIKQSKFVMVYNSSIGLEAVLLGKVVLCGGKARYTQYDIANLPESPDEFRQLAEEFLKPGTQLRLHNAFFNNARKYMYYQIFKASIPFDEFIEKDTTRPGYVRLKSLEWYQLKPEHSQTMKILVDGIIDGKPFLMDGI